MSDTMMPSQRWQSEASLPETDEDMLTAERLVLLVHYGADFSVWGAARRVRYWDALMERVKASTYAGPSLSDWWSAICSSLPSSPRDAAERRDAAMLLVTGRQREVLRLLRSRPDVVVLRVRVIAETRKQAYLESHSEASLTPTEDVP